MTAYSFFARELKNYHGLYETERKNNQEFKAKLEQSNKRVETISFGFAIAVVIGAILGYFGLPAIVDDVASKVIGDELVEVCNCMVHPLEGMFVGYRTV